ncbi:hypothetical protein BCT01_24250 [Vibrio tasmaniensis]|uniref:Uncharacterized protein n=1 Tax=Vibrio tasmaniensis 1F-267 TaxID=1191324 RepID=A0ABX3B630_9VIBR|nr:hypothetical protein [Vibrio tasmaniensis]OEF48392.1 hypothetical protein A163_06355 [Vibrio tasmaniensis 1F-267]OEF66074.1 hypothetical protein A152_21100 [Vibrio tasmaniensis 1F-187]OEF83864.1 hypothetical protein A162_11540 [Vibrio tasmaniensis 1F-155]PML14004.1 hypothetical protein BCT83_17915 [Vibrio tasmaniensis]PML42598.1 hypothetical protein BCT76_22055 [Vibrio tasmaniensis]
MYQELSQLLDDIGYAFDKHELKICTIRAQKNKVIKAMIVKAKELNFDISSNLSKSVLSAIVSQEDINEQQAIDVLTKYVISDNIIQREMRESLFLAAMRKSEEFHIVMLLNGEGVNRVI